MDTFIGQDLTCVRGERRVFSGLAFDVAASAVLTLVGPNGSGKSSLLRMMAGLLPPFAGSMLWSGHDVTDDRDAHRSRVVYVGHQDAVKPVLTVGENLEFWAVMSGRDAASVDKALEGMGIRHLVDVPGRFLSAGQKRRLNLARILVSDAALWLLDEPTTALDASAIEALKRAIERHRAASGIVVLSTHSDLGLGDTSSLDLARYAVDQDQEAAP